MFLPSKHWNYLHQNAFPSVYLICFLTWFFFIILLSDLQAGKKKRIKLVLDREHDTTSTGEDSGPDVQRNRVPNVTSYSNINGSVYLAQNGTIIRTRRPPYPNNLKMGSPVRLGKQFKKLDKLGVTHEEQLPLNGTGDNGPTVGITTTLSSVTDHNLNSKDCSVTGPSSIGPKSNIDKARLEHDRGRCEQESSVDSGGIKESVESPCDQTLTSDEEELWMGPWNNLHIPMTKLWFLLLLMLIVLFSF